MAYLLGEEASGDDLKQLEAWLEKSPRNRAEFEILQQGWHLTGDLEQDPGIFPKAVRQPGWRRGLLAAAAVALTIFTALWVVRSQDQALQHRTSQGEQRTIALQDGSRVHLNTATTLNVGAGGREVKLLEGEAFFDVRSQPSRHFSVDAGAGQIRVLGTQFNVLRNGDDVLISVLEGRVAVEARGQAGTEESSFELSVGQTLEIGGEAGPRLLDDGSDLARVKAWQEGKVDFDRTPLHEAVRELSRYTPEALRVADPSLEELRVSGVFRIDRLADLDSVRFALENSLPVTLRASGDSLELIPASP